MHQLAQSSFIPVGSGSSQSIFWLQNSWNSTFIWNVTGEIIPNGSNILATILQMLHFVGGNLRANYAKGLSGNINQSSK